MQLRIATLNVWGIPAIAPGVPQRLRAIGRRLAELDLDVIAFQEVWTATTRRILLRAGRAAGLRHAWHTNAAFGGSGLLVLSRLPVLGAQFERFLLRGAPERITQGDYYGGKGFARVRLETRVGPVTLINTHLHARYGGAVAHEYRAVRAAQVVELAVRVRETRDPIIAAGDFNFQEGQAGYRVLTGLTGFRDTAAEVGQRQPTIHHGNVYRRNPRKSERRIDFVFARDGRELGVFTQRVRRVFDGEIEIAGRRAGYSNHAGILAELVVAPSATAGAQPPDKEALALAANLLSEGRHEALCRQRDGRRLASAGVGGAALALCALRTKPMTRRKLLRQLVQTAGLAAVLPAAGYSVLSEYFVPDELAGFAAVADRLTAFERAAGDSNGA